MNNENIIPKIKSKRYNSDTGEYNKKPNDPEYFKKYWQEHNEKVPCARCGCMVVKLRMCKHIKSQKCQMVAKTAMCYQTVVVLLENKVLELQDEISKQKPLEMSILAKAKINGPKLHFGSSDSEN